MKTALLTRHLPSNPAKCPPKRAFPHAVTQNPAIRDCVDCGLPFYSRSTANVVCLPCKAYSTAEFEQGGI